MKSHLIKKAYTEILEAPLTQPFRIASGQHDNLKNVFLCLELNNGIKGYGEAAIATHITGETVKVTQENLRASCAYLLGKDLFDYRALSGNLSGRLCNNKSGLAAVEMALMDALARALKVPLWKFFSNSAKRLTTDITIVISDLEQTENAARKFYRQGFGTFKVKIGHDWDTDIKRVILVHRVAPGAKIILDANQSYCAKEALEFLKLVKKYGVNPILIEQPVPKDDWEGLKKVTRASGVCVCADESVSTIEDTMRAIKQKAVDAVNVKITKSGLFGAHEIALICRAAGIKLMIGGMMESSLGMTASAHLACGMGCFDYIDLDTPFFIKGPLGDNPYLSRRGVYVLLKVKAGIGIIPKIKR